ncbi:unnamed protein product [Brachionus calyciflorus]|uniref:Uncharacterized protein n=1 Tax=Brachionus calyciflorus TaxID=104777 RepID=A0A813PN25_9BILA|nr:unnamed protein product [Brachionus calyciflorus]
MEIVISRKLLESLKLEDLNDILSVIVDLKTKAEYDKFIKEAVVDKKKLGEVTAMDRMVDLIQRISNYYELTKQEKINKMEKQQDVFREPSNTSTVRNASGTNQIMIESDWIRDIAEREQIIREVNETLANGIIEHSTLPWASPVLIVPKKDVSKRFCVDYTKFNNVTVTENWPIPRIEDILDRLSGSLF